MNIVVALLTIDHPSVKFDKRCAPDPKPKTDDWQQLPFQSATANQQP
jgi:hypothetical protein